MARNAASASRTDRRRQRPPAPRRQSGTEPQRPHFQIGVQQRGPAPRPGIAGKRKCRTAHQRHHRQGGPGPRDCPAVVTGKSRRWTPPPVRENQRERTAPPRPATARPRRRRSARRTGQHLPGAPTGAGHQFRCVGFDTTAGGGRFGAKMKASASTVMASPYHCNQARV